MPYNSTTGVFVRTNNTFSASVQGTAIDPEDAVALFDDYDLALNNVTNNILVDKGTVSSGTVTFAATAHKQKLTVGGALTVAFSTWPASGIYGEVEIQLVNGGAFTVTWPGAVNWLVGDGTNSPVFADMGVTLATSGTNWVVVWTTDGGTVMYGKAG